MKFIISIVLTALLTFAAGLYLSWWSIALAAFAVSAFIPQRPLKAWLSGFLGVFLVWALTAWWIDLENESILSRRIAELFSLGDSTWLLIIISAFVGALVGGMASLTASFIRKRP